MEILDRYVYCMDNNDRATAQLREEVKVVTSAVATRRGGL